MATKLLPSFMLLLLSSLLVMPVSYGQAKKKQERITSKQKDEVLNEFKRELDTYRQQGQGKIDLAVVKPVLRDLIYDYRESYLLSDDEVLAYTKKFEHLEQQKQLNDDQKYGALMGMMEQLLKDVSTSPMKLLKAGEICNNWQCEEGTVCAAEPMRHGVPASARSKAGTEGANSKNENKCMQVNTACESDEQCCSGDCNLDFKTKKRVCAVVKRCYRPQKVGADCFNNPVCDVGACLAYNKNTASLGSCRLENRQCKNDKQCCSNKCSDGKCVDNFLCKNCVTQGQKPQRGRECCEGLRLDDQGVCIPDAPPFVLPIIKNNINRPGPVELKITERLLASMLSLFMSTAQAQTDAAPKEFATFFKEKGMLRPSNFQTCEIKITDDYLLHLKDKDVFQVEAAMISFEYMALGDGVQDLWRDKGNSNKNMYTVAQDLAKQQQDERKKIFAEVDRIDHDLKCRCYDYKGFGDINDEQKKYFREKCGDTFIQHFCQDDTHYDKLTQTEKDQVQALCPNMKLLCRDYSNMKDLSSDKQAYFKENCGKISDDIAEAQEYKEENGDIVKAISRSGDASSIKYKKLLADWADAYQGLFTLKTDLNLEVHAKFGELSSRISSQNWDQSELKSYSLYNFTILHMQDAALAAGAAMGVLIAIAIIGSAVPGVLSAWASAGIIAGSAVAGAGGFWLVGAINGAWTTNKPATTDEVVRANYKCTSDDKKLCSDYKRALWQPYNDMCKIHASSAACIQSFLVTREPNLNYDKVPGDLVSEREKDFSSIDQKDSYYLIDPWVPLYVNKGDLIKDSTGYYQLLEDGFQRGLNMLRMKSPGGMQEPEYLQQSILDAIAVGQFTPPLKNSYEQTYMLSDQGKQKIKDGIKRYAAEQRLFYAEDAESLNKFADYAYKFHYLYPKIVFRNSISYPPPGLATYVGMLSFGKGSSAAVSTAATRTMVDLASNYLNDYVSTLMQYRQGNNFGKAKPEIIKAVDREIQTNQQRLKQIAMFKGALGTTASTASNGKASGNLVSGSGTIGDNSLGGLTARQKGVLSGIKKYRDLRSKQLKALDDFNRAAKASGNGDELINGQGDLASQFFNPFGNKSAMTGKGSGLQLASLDPSLSKNGAGSGAGGDGASDASKANLIYGGDVHSLDSKDGKNGASGVGGDSSAWGDGSGADGAGGNGSGSGNNVGGEDGMSAEDRAKIAEAINASKDNQGAYDGQEGDSLFEKVTKAYIRNYGRILKPKVDVQ